MATRGAYNKNNSGVKRIMAEARELERDLSPDYSAGPTEGDIFDWHCTIRGPPDSEFEGGLYHARIVLPPEYPFKAPSIMLLTPNGRFELNKKICISFTAYHEDLWQPSWGVRTAIIGLQSFFPVKGEGALGVGGIEVSIAERKRLAALSRDWVCPQCNQSNHELLPDPPKSESETAAEATSESSAAVPTELPTSETPLTIPTVSESAPPILVADSPLSQPIPAPPPATSLNLSPSTLSPSSSDSISIPTAPTVSLTTSPKVPVVVVEAPKVEATSSASAAHSVAVAQHPTSIQLPSSNPSSIVGSRPIDLTPSTPAARIIPARDDPFRHQPQPQVIVEHVGAMAGLEGGADGGDDYGIGTNPARSLLVVDTAIGVLSMVLGGLVLKRFL